MLSYHQKRFLIVDDFSDFRSSVRSMLRELGVKEVDTADTGEQALKMCSQKAYDFILQDFHLGDGKKNGQQVLEDLMEEKLISHESVFVMVTAETSQAMVLSALEHEPDAYLTKPFNRSSPAQRPERLEQRKTLLKPILQALDRGKPMEVLNACIVLCKQDIRYSPLCLRYRADALRDLNQNEALERLYDSIIADRPLPWAFAGLGKLLFKRGQVAQAKGIYEKALKVFPMMPSLYDGMADVLVTEGDTRAQRVLEEAIRLSPLAVRRQAMLGKLAMTNEDFDTASKAYRQAVAQGAQSRFKDAESNLGLAHALISKGSERGPDTRTRLEINTTLSAVAKENPGDPGLQIRARLMKATSLLLNDAETADKLTEQALLRLDGMEQFMSAEAALLVAKQLKMLGQSEAGTAMLKSCVEIYGDDPVVMKDIAKQTDDPTILNSGNAAADLNRQGVRVYKTGNLVEARQLFRKALAMQPKNISIALNMAQSLLHGTDTSVASAELEECQACLKMVGLMPETDARYPRYQKLKKQGVWRMNDNEQGSDFSTVIASTVHDMKNSLTLLMQAHSQWLARLPAPAQQTPEQGVIDFEFAHLNGMLVQLLGLYKLGVNQMPLRPAYHELDDFIEAQLACHQEVFASRGIMVTYEVDPLSPLGFFDRELIASVLANCINNAIRYARHALLISVSDEGGQLVLTINDDGEGYPAQMIERQADYVQGINQSSGSTGLGLYFAGQIAALHQRNGVGGRTEISNGGPLGGGVFSLYLP